jgi:hypothetical protein
LPPKSPPELLQFASVIISGIAPLSGSQRS